VTLSLLRILALDQSTRTGWAFGVEKSDDRWLFGSFKLPKRDDNGERLVIFRNDLSDLIQTHQPDLIAYETPYFPLQEFRPKFSADRDGEAPAKEGPRFNPATVAFLLHIQGVLLELTARRSIPTQAFTSSSWRVTALGFGRAKGIGSAEFKAMMMKRAQALGYAVKDDNEADAIGILMHMLMGEPASKRMQGDLLELAKAKL
jgi:Holliday junction resolvasome RuvABC endonuclease subunit